MTLGNDQASTLRNWTHRRTAQDASASPVDYRVPRVIAVASGKGGVGKTNIAANLALVFARSGSRVLLVDGDLGLANLDLALGFTHERSLADVLSGEAKVDEVLVEAGGGVTVLPACSGRYDLVNLDDRDRHGLFACIDTLEERFDTLIIDTAAGIGSNAMAFAGAAEHVLIVANGEPTALADAYAFIKVLSQRSAVTRVHFVANMVRTPAEGEEVFRQLARLLDRFLRIGVDYLGYVARDSAVSRSICSGVPVLHAEPRAPASQCIESIAHRLAGHYAPSTHGGVRLFWRRVLQQRKAS